MAETIIINSEKIGVQALKLQVKKFYDTNLKGKSVINKEKGITVTFSNVGRNHVLYAGAAGFEKLIAVYKLAEMVRNAKFCNFQAPDEDAPQGILGYMNFKVSVIINGVVQHFRIAIRITKNGKFFYNHSVWVKK